MLLSTCLQMPHSTQALFVDLIVRTFSFQLVGSLVAVKASYIISYHVAKRMKPCTTCEVLFVPCMKRVVSATIGKKHARKLEKIPHSNDTLARRERKMAFDVQSQII